MMSHRRTARAAALALLLSAAACAGSQGAGSPATAGSGVEGRTMVDGGCPVVREQSPCPEKPLSARLTITGGDPERTVAETTSDADGRFRIPLPPGNYSVHPANLTGAVAPIAQPVAVTVTSGHFTTISVLFDSGVR